ncbi:MAG TPA: hypothetical protein VGO89_18420 [Streptomyces sp.]|jgi:hypothetical protein|nr:hypothetical protein [Streptomyces sp.]
MVDQTAVNVTVHWCPPHSVQALLDVLGKHDLGELFSSDVVVSDEDGKLVRLVLGRVYGAWETEWDRSAELANELIEAAGEAAFTVFEVPCYDRVGQTHCYVPGLGMFSAACGTDGSPLFYLNGMLRIADAPEAIRRIALGEPWRLAVESMEAEIYGGKGSDHG